MLNEDGIPRYYFSQEWRDLRDAVLKRDKRICQYCGEKASTADHVAPRYRGGPDTMENLVASCRTCNRIAGGKWFRTFSAKRDFIMAQRGPAIPKQPVPRQFRESTLKSKLRERHAKRPR